ncbi:MAG: PEP-CTERM sorting domain-containing protein [Blastochloris sp.]|nr:PEP-CTERM sorting domain-containing protein [Blastochloris sp.]
MTAKIGKKEKTKMKKLLLILAAMAAVSGAQAQVIWTNPITATNPSLDNPFTTGQTFNTNVTVSGIGRGTGITGNAGGDRYNAGGWNNADLAATIVDNAYFTFTLQANTGFEIDFNTFAYTGQASGTGPTGFAFRSSVDSFAANLGAPTATGVSIDLSAASFQNLTGPIEFRLYGFGASSAAGTFSVNDFTFSGNVAVVPEPSTYALLGLGLGALWVLRRQRSHKEAAQNS